MKRYRVSALIRASQVIVALLVLVCVRGSATGRATVYVGSSATFLPGTPVAAELYGSQDSEPVDVEVTATRIDAVTAVRVLESRSASEDAFSSKHPLRRLRIRIQPGYYRRNTVPLGELPIGLYGIRFVSPRYIALQVINVTTLGILSTGRTSSIYAVTIDLQHVQTSQRRKRKDCRWTGL